MTTSPSDELLIAGARAYVDALVSHDPTGVPLDAACTRTEMGIRTGWNGRHIERGLARGPQFRVIREIYGFRAEVVDGVVVTVFTVRVHPRWLGVQAEVTESFEFGDSGRIVRIVARIGLPRRGR